MDGSGVIEKACLIFCKESDGLLLFPESASEAGKGHRKNTEVLYDTDVQNDRKVIENC